MINRETLDARINAEAVLPPVTGDGVEFVTPTSWAQKKALELHVELGSWRAVAAALAPYYKASATAWWAVSRGEKDSPEKVDALLRYCGLPALPVAILVPPCPDCGLVHTGRCHNRPVIVEVAVLAPGERVAPAGAQIVRRSPAKRWRDLPVSRLAAAIRNRHEYLPDQKGA